MKISTLKSILLHLEEEIKDDNPLTLDGVAIDYRNGFFVLFSDEDFPSYWIPIGGWEDLTHQRYESLLDAINAYEQLK